MSHAASVSGVVHHMRIHFGGRERLHVIGGLQHMLCLDIVPHVRVTRRYRLCVLW